MGTQKPHGGADQSFGEMRLPEKMSKWFSSISRLQMRNLNDLRSTPTFYRYNKEQIATYIANPYRYERQLRNAMIYIYNASPLFRRLIQYFVGLSDLSFVISPRVDPRTANINSVNRNYRKVLNTMTAMRIRTQLPQILTVCLREDVYYGTFRVTTDDIIIQRLPSDYCRIATIEDNVPNVTFNFSYFDVYPEQLEYYPEEFRRKYEQIYKKNMLERWIELDSPNSFAIKCNMDILEYAMPPFAGLLRDLYDLEDYRDLKKAKTALENYALLVMYLDQDDDGNWKLDYDKAVSFYHNLDSEVPEEVGTVLSPMKVDKIGFEKSNTGDTDTVAEATQNIFTTAGVSAQLFNNSKPSANALLLSIKADQMVTYGIVKNIENVINRFIRHQNYGKYWTVTFLDVSPYNRKEMGDQYLKACQYGLPMISCFCASQGLGQAELDSMSYLEGEVLGLQDLFRPIVNSAQLSNDGTDTSTEAETKESGRPRSNDEDLTDSGEQSREDSDDWG